MSHFIGCFLVAEIVCIATEIPRLMGINECLFCAMGAEKKERRSAKVQ